MSSKLADVIDPILKVAGCVFMILILIILDLLCLFVWDYEGYLFTLINFIMGVFIYKACRNTYKVVQGLRQN